jgi:hypothetical protein
MLKDGHDIWPDDSPASSIEEAVKPVGAWGFLGRGVLDGFLNFLGRERVVEAGVGQGG